MTLKELAQNLNVETKHILSVLKQVNIVISDETDTQISEALCQIITENKDKIEEINASENAIPYDELVDLLTLYGIKLNKQDFQILQNQIEASKGLEGAEQETLLPESYSTIESLENDTVNLLMPFFEKNDTFIIREIKRFNELDTLLLNGRYSKNRERNFGFFNNVRNLEGKRIYYPILKELIDSVFVAPNMLVHGNTYTFEVKVARKEKRKTQSNPFLLEAKTDNIQEVVVLSELKLEVLKTQQLITEVESLFIQKESEANQVIEEYNQAIINKYNEIQVKESLIFDLNNQLSEFTNKKSEMEVTINFLRQKIDICKNLEFMSQQDGDKFLQILGTEPFNMGDEYLDFEKYLSASFPNLVNHLQNYLYHKKNLIYTEFQISNFLSLLMTNDLIVLSGLSGSGKTQIVKSFAEALGGVAKIIPVKPNWTSSDDLLGYYNPIQSSFLPTPFTEAIAEAIQNPHQIYLICLDEMNLARVEYYFADFLSKMEERSQQPEIELYAKHEEELFISEFKTLLTLMESAAGEKSVSSWQEFLETDSIRNRFFELLGNTEKDTMLQIHSKMKRRLLDILKFPATIRIPNNVRFIGAINVDETTHYFSPKILDRVHIVKFENPLLLEDIVRSKMENSNYEGELKPVYLNPVFLNERKEYPSVSETRHKEIFELLKKVNKDYLLPLNIDFGIRSIRQALNYIDTFRTVNYKNNNADYIQYDDAEQSVAHEMYADAEPYIPENIRNLSLNTVIVQKILPRLIFDGSVNLKNGETKIQLLEKFIIFLEKELSYLKDMDSFNTGYASFKYLQNMVTDAKLNNDQVNFYA